MNKKLIKKLATRLSCFNQARCFPSPPRNGFIDFQINNFDLRQCAENNPQDTPSSHAPAWEFIRQRSSVTGGIPTPERVNDRVVVIYCELP
ncbi:MAG: hypothetical protein WCS87_09340 [Methylococcaceae bacterium]